MWTRGYARTVYASKLGWDSRWQRGICCMWADIEGWYGGGDAAGGPWQCSGQVGGGPWAWGAAFETWRDEARRASAAARSAMKVVVAA